MTAPVGVVLASATRPELIGPSAKQAEELGFSELWIPEDYFYLGSIACLVQALAATKRVPVGVGVMSAMVRHPAVAAMEIACAERMYPGRVRPGIGLGVPPIIGQMGLKPRSQLAAVREYVTMLRALLGGEECNVPEGEFQAHAIKLTHAPDAVPPIYTGVLGPKMLRLSGEVADGTVISSMASPAYVSWLKERVEEGVAKRAGGVGGSHRLPTFAMYCLDDDEAAARDAVRPLVALYLSHLAQSPLVTVNDFGAEVADMCERGGADAMALIAKEIPDAWLEELTVAGNPETCAQRIDRLLEAGADSVVLMPVRPDSVESELRRTAAEVFGRLEQAVQQGAA